MMPAARQQKILEMIVPTGMISIADAATRLGVSQMTIRRDMQNLEERGKLITVSGGAKKLERITSELSQPEKRVLYYAEKSAIAAKAVSLIKPAMAVFVDAGTTGLAIAERIAVQPELCESILVISNDFTVCGYLMAHSPCRLYHTGGEILRENQSCSGESAAQFISRLNLDMAFLSTSSWDANWISTPSEKKVVLKVAARKAARHAFLVTDSSKYGRIGLFNILRITDLDGIITDTALPENAQAAIARAGVNLMLVEPMQYPKYQDTGCAKAPESALAGNAYI